MLNYNTLLQFFKKFKAQGFQQIDPNDSLLLELNINLQATGQFFHIADLVQLKLLYGSREFFDFYGIVSGKEDPSVFINLIHPDDATRFGLLRSKAFKMSAEMLEKKLDRMILSSNLRTKTPNGNYVDLLYQTHLCYTEIPYKTVLSIVVNTDISPQLINKLGYHYYVGNDESFFRYPDKRLLNFGNVFSHREFDILQYIAQGLDSHEIAEKLFLSVHTVNTHRRNILKKTGKRTTHEIVMDLMEKGVL